MYSQNGDSASVGGFGGCPNPQFQNAPSVALIHHSRVISQFARVLALRNLLSFLDLTLAGTDHALARSMLYRLA